ncbi:cytochrome P450 [Pseudonocardia sp. KRD-182]|nr:cytochrome P450 [Pseudonocardia oceani]
MPLTTGTGAGAGAGAAPGSGAATGSGTATWERRVQLGAHPVAYPLVRALARIGPVVRVPRVGVVVSDAALARAVLTDTASFAKTGPGSPAALWTPVVGPSVLLNMEGAEHAALRRALADLFTPSAVAALCSRVLAGPCAELRGRLVAGEAVDLVPVAQRAAGAVIAGLVGLDARDAAGPAFAAATAVTGMVRLARPELTPRQAARGRAALARITAPAADAYREGGPGTVPGRMRELGLSEREALGAVAAFALTGTETVVSFLPRLVALLHDAGLLDALAADRGGVDACVEEALRVTVPSPVMLRRVAAPARIGTVDVVAGDRVVIATVSAARAHGGFDPDRPHPPALRRLWFGAGPHFCLGMPLAVAQVRLVLDAVLDAHGQRPLRVVRRRVARRVLIPAYREMVVRGG